MQKWHFVAKQAIVHEQDRQVGWVASEYMEYLRCREDFVKELAFLSSTVGCTTPGSSFLCSSEADPQLQSFARQNTTGDATTSAEEGEQRNGPLGHGGRSCALGGLRNKLAHHDGRGKQNHNSCSTANAARFLRQPCSPLLTETDMEQLLRRNAVASTKLSGTTRTTSAAARPGGAAGTFDWPAWYERQKEMVLACHQQSEAEEEQDHVADQLERCAFTGKQVADEDITGVPSCAANTRRTHVEQDASLCRGCVSSSGPAGQLYSCEVGGGGMSKDFPDQTHTATPQELEQHDKKNNKGFLAPATSAPMFQQEQQPVLVHPHDTVSTGASSKERAATAKKAGKPPKGAGGPPPTVSGATTGFIPPGEFLEDSTEALFTADVKVLEKHSVGDKVRKMLSRCELVPPDHGCSPDQFCEGRLDFERATLNPDGSGLGFDVEHPLWVNHIHLTSQAAEDMEPVVLVHPAAYGREFRV
ncbi:unnamed protein product [Amoebophrya sp. A120]|nr:unnamed protein product [Amoebophrya sp. A120]|eukprot:GSA120T00010671001.1